MSFFGRYREIALLGQGGMAKVSLAALPGALGAQKLVVIKEILPELAVDPDFVAMFTDEARLAARLEHPNLVQTFDVGEDAGRFFIVMEYLDGQPLSALLGRTRRQLPLPVHLHILTRVLSGLHAAHELTDLTGSPLGVVHRDVTPQNIFLTYGGAIKLVDFGIAKAKGAAVRTQTGVFKGKLAYAATEQITNESVDRRADVFAAGVLLWEALAKRRITQDLTEPAILHQRINGKDPPIATVVPDVPKELAAICDRAMASDREARYATAAQMLEALDAYIEKTGIRVTDADVGALVAREFEQERSNVRRLVQERLSAPEGAPAGKPTPLLPPPSPSSESGVSDVDPTLRADGVKLITSPTHASVSVDLASARGASRRRALLTVAIAAVAVVAVASFALRTRRAPATAVAPPIAESVPVVDAAPNAEAASVEVSVTATPAAARFTLDGLALETNPFTRHIPRDDKPHTLAIAAPGFVGEERTIVLDRDVRLELALQPETRPTAGRPSPRPPPPPPADDPPRGRRPTKPIDTADPWGKK
jgi:eukaryotic-like serine/threonine-protein kinase